MKIATKFPSCLGFRIQQNWDRLRPQRKSFWVAFLCVCMCVSHKLKLHGKNHNFLSIPPSPILFRLVCSCACAVLSPKYGKTTISIIIKFLRGKWQVLWNFEFVLNSSHTIPYILPSYSLLRFGGGSISFSFPFHSICNYKANCFNIIISSFLRATQLIIHNLFGIASTKLNHRVSPSLYSNYLLVHSSQMAIFYHVSFFMTYFHYLKY